MMPARSYIAGTLMGTLVSRRQHHIGSRSVSRRPFRRALGGLILPFLLTSTATAEVPLPDAARLKSSPVLRHLRPNPPSNLPRTAAGETLARMHVPEGFRVELIAAEPDVRQPVAMAFDERGRIWVAEAHSYPAKQTPGNGQDRLVILEDSDGNGSFDHRKVFVEGLNLVSGFEVGHGGVWIGAAPELLFLPDRDHNDVPDGPPEVLLEGFGYQDTHECLNSFLWGPDGWLYGTQGVFNESHIGRPGSAATDRTELRAGVWRYHPVRREFEVFAHGGSNPWGLDFDEHGQLFMTHCRSYWGGGLTTHVIQGGHYWNQANANHAPFIIGDPPGEYPEYRNYLLASARYDHGAGGAGPQGSDAIYGGHSHVGTMIYLGDNWPAEYRGNLFTHNLHGHQINQQVNRRVGSGFDTVHAGRDMFFCSDPSYVAVDLQYGPDGAVYIIDWYDRQHCHNPNTERWDRSNGRIYRLQFEATYAPARVDLGSVDDDGLARLQTHSNDWHARTARRLLQERAALRPIDAGAVQRLRALLKDPSAARRLRALWCLHAVGGLSPEVRTAALADDNPHVRAWMIQLSADPRESPPPAWESAGLEMARNDPSPVVRLALASAAQRVAPSTALAWLKALVQHTEDRTDRNLPKLLWQALATQMPGRPGEAFDVVRESRLELLADWASWYGMSLGTDARERALASLRGLAEPALTRRLAGLSLALDSLGRVHPPATWASHGPVLLAHNNRRIREFAERIAASFGDASAFPRLRQELSSPTAEPRARQHAFDVLSRGPDPDSVAVFLGLFDDAQFRSRALVVAGRYDSERVGQAILPRLESLAAGDRSAALGALCSRERHALALLDAIASGAVPRDTLTAFHIRQLSELKSPALDRRIEATWGRMTPTPAEKQRQIARLRRTFDEAPLWAYDASEGRKHFQKLCAPCHKLGADGVRLGPELTGAGSRGIGYFLENLIDPDAVVGRDFQLTQVRTRTGELVSGLVLQETPAAISLKTLAETISIPKAEIEQRETLEKSLMPEGLLESLAAREQLELLKYLTSN